MKLLDLKYGNPVFMQPYWDYQPLMDSLEIHPGNDVGYLPSPLLPELEAAIQKIHEKIGNADTANRKIVIGCGATQILHAALYALKSFKNDTVYLRPPYWFRYPRIIRDMNYSIENTGARPQVEILTLPSNPDNELYQPQGAHYEIYDLSYNWPQYGSPQKYQGDVLVFSLAKATGHGSSRVGWAIVEDETIARKMLEYIEYATGGVSVEAQRRAVSLLNYQSAILDGQYIYTASCFEFGKQILEDRWKQLKEVNSDSFETLNNSGMFAWCRYKNANAQFELLTDLSITASAGNLSGGEKYNVRLNVGCTEEEFQELLVRLRSLK